MKAFIRTFFATMLAIIVLFAVVIGVLAAKTSQKEKIEDRSWLVLDIYGDIPEYDPPSDPMSQLMGGSPETLQRLLDNLDKARIDERIEGVIMKICSSNTLGMAKVQELRDAIARVRADGKPVYCYSDAMAKKSYYLAAACDSIFMPASAWFEMTGFGVTSTHVKRMLEKIGVNVNLHRIKDYKSAAEVVIREDLSEEARENIQWIMDDVWNTIMEDLETDRGLNEERVVELMDYAMFTPEEAQAANLIDDVIYWDEFEARLKGEDDEELRTVCSERYGEESFEDLGVKGKKKIAVVHAQGLIGGRRSTINPMLGMIMGHETVAGDLKRATDDDDVVAVILRVDSGGGENTASDLIGHQVEVTSREKPIIASMVDQAASGGYQVSFRADRIVALPLTSTGSIGSISAKFNINELHEKLGITHDTMTKGPKALMWSSYSNFTEEERERFEENHWQDFNLWLSRVAEERGMTFKEVEALAHGRVWTGRQAAENGLIDEVGGLEKAVALARELAEVPDDEDVTIVHYPVEQDLMEMIFSGGDLSSAARWMVYRFIHEDLAATWELAEAKLMGSPRMHVMPDFEIE